MIKFANKKGFTLIEIVLASIILGVGLVSILVAIGKGQRHIDRTRKEIIAINLAREGMESVFNIRDSNWKRRSGRREDCWLKENPLEDTNGADDDCGNDNRIQADTNYVLSGKASNGGGFQTFYYFLSGVGTNKLNLYDGRDTEDFTFKLCLDDNRGWHACPGDHTATAEGSFFRIIEGKKLLDKNESKIMTGCINGSSTASIGGPCGGSNIIGRSKEMIFCSRVEYFGAGLGKIEFCSSVTNFLN